jgi:hypothetical protein
MDGRMRVAILGALLLQVACDRSREGGTDPVSPEVGLRKLAADLKACKGEPCAELAAVELLKHGESVAAKGAGPELGCDPARAEAERAMASLSACIRVAKGSGGTNAAIVAIAERVDACRDDACVAAAEADLAKLSAEAGKGAEAGPDPEACRGERDAAAAGISGFQECADAALGSDVDAAVRKMGEFAASMCDCKDKECALRVSNEMTQYGEMMAKRHAGKPEPTITPDQKRRMEEATRRLMECTTRAMGG